MGHLIATKGQSRDWNWDRSTWGEVCRQSSIGLTKNFAKSLLLRPYAHNDHGARASVGMGSPSTYLREKKVSPTAGNNDV